jgi:hypothetical protein
LLAGPAAFAAMMFMDNRLAHADAAVGCTDGAAFVRLDAAQH